MKFSFSGIGLLIGLAPAVLGLEVDWTDTTSVHSAMSAIAFDLMQYYTGNLTGQVPGLLPGPCTGENCYYYGTAGLMWGAMINYFQVTGDSTYQDNVLKALAFQIGPEKNYNPPNQSKVLVTDDQSFWAFAAMEAAEAGVPDLNDGITPTWIELAEAVFNFQVQLWDSATCDGGLRWSVYSFNTGYNLKTIMSNGAFFQLSARLARYTGNSTYADWANKAYDWIASSSLEETTNGTLYFWDNTDADTGCTDAQHYVWTSSYGTVLMGSAMMYNYTNGETKWKDRVTSILDSALTLFFPPEYRSEVMSEILCEPSSNCNSDQSAFKASLARWMSVASVVAPFTFAQISSKLSLTAKSAASQCSGGANGRKCGRQWYSSTWDGTEGVGQQLSALAVIGATQMNPVFAPLTAATNTNATRTGSNNTSNSGSGANNTSGGNAANKAATVSYLGTPMTIAFGIILAFASSNLL